MVNTPIFVVSDLHIGSKGIRDNFSHDNRSCFFNSFLDHVEKENGELIILGDFIDLWKFNLDKVIKARIDLLDRLAEMKVYFIPGNHDQAFVRYINSQCVPHPFFRKLTKPFVKIIGGKKFSFIHGHELDFFNRNLTPHMGRAFGLSSSLIEYAKGCPLLSSDAIEETLLNIEEKLFLFFSNIAQYVINLDYSSELLRNIQILPRQRRIDKFILKQALKRNSDCNDVSISAHTHHLCRFQNWYFNSGSWTDRTNDFIQILPDGKVNLFNWQAGSPRLNNNELTSSSYYSKFKTGYIMVN